MRGALVAAAVCAGLLLCVDKVTGAPLDEPVAIDVKAPAAVALKEAFKLRVVVAAEAGALDIAAQPIRLRVRLARACGGSFAGTRGPTAVDRVLRAPVAGAAYRATVRTRSRLRHFGAVTVCAFIEDVQERQFATSTEVRVKATRACTRAKREGKGCVRAPAHRRHGRPAPPG
jgi:hypothetical protein